MHKWLLVPVVIVAAVLATSSLIAQTADPFVGTWKLNVAASKWDPGPPSKSNTRTVEDRGGGLFVVTNRGIDSQGNPTFSHVAAKYDGREYPYASKGSQTFDTLSYRRVDASTIEYTIRRDGKVSSTNTRTLSKDGKTYTDRTKGTNAQGQPFNNVLVYDKQ